MSPKIAQLDIPSDKRLICISDIHGELDLFKQLLKKIDFCDDDILVLLGDIYLKGSQCHACLKYVMELSEKPNVHVLRGNCDISYLSYLDIDDIMWIEALPHIIESENFIFIHAGITNMNLEEQDPVFCMKNDSFIESYDGPAFEKWVVVGHWPVDNCCHTIPCQSPIINNEKRIINIDGGNVVRETGQLNAFIVFNNEFSFAGVDKLSTTIIEKHQNGSKGTLHITWQDRFVEIAEDGEEFVSVRHLASGKIIEMPKTKIWKDADGRLCAGTMATDHFLSVKPGDVVSVVSDFSDRIFAKINGVCGWIYK